MSLSDILSEIESLEPKERETYIRAPFGWPGGKWQSLKYLLPIIPKGGTLHDGCGGSGIVTINAEGYDLKIFNDRHAGVVAFYRCLRDWDKQQKLVDRLSFSLHSREEFLWAHDSWENCTDDVERAARWYYMLRTSFAHLGRNFGRSTSGANPISRKLHNALDDFPKFHAIFKHVQIENLDVVQSIRDYDSPSTKHYIDPDYIGCDPGIYKHKVQQREMLDALAECKGFVALSGYDNELYNSYKWDDIRQWDVSVSMTSQAFIDRLHDKRDVMGRDRRAVETLWIRSSR